MLSFYFNTDSGAVKATMCPEALARGELGPEGYPYWIIKCIQHDKGESVDGFRETCRSSDLLGLVDEHFGSAVKG